MTLFELRPQLDLRIKRKNSLPAEMDLLPMALTATVATLSQTDRGRKFTYDPQSLQLEALIFCALLARGLEENYELW